MPSSTRVTERSGSRRHSAQIFSSSLSSMPPAKKRPLRSHFAVVQARARVFGIDERYGFELAALEIEEVEAVVEREHRAAFLAQRERADVALDRPVLGLAALRIEAPNRRLVDAPAGPVDPVEPALLDVPDRPSPRWLAHCRTHSIFIHAARSERPARSSRPAAISALRICSISAFGSFTSGGRTTARGSLPIMTSASFMRLCMSTQGSE